MEDRFRPTKAGWENSVAMVLAYSAVLCVLVVFLPSGIFDSTSDIFILSVGTIALWRYSWWFTHYIRGVIYRRSTFPKMRWAADAVTEQGYRPGHIFVLCTSYRIEPTVTYAVYEGLIRNAIEYGVPTTVFAAISDRTDVDVLNRLLADYDHPEIIEIRYMYQRGDGKRSAMGEVLRAISRCQPASDDLVVFMDGDIRLPATTFRRSMPFFFLEDDLGALTTNNGAIVEGSDLTKEWYNLRYAQRHTLMCSTSLSRRVLVLTGRYSVIRADLCTSPDFIELVERDTLKHRRFGTVALLSGDDKSTWFWLLKNNWAMRYIPDVHVYGFESLPNSKRFFAGTISLMRRWFGNMFRTSERAIALGPRGMGLFTWWCLVDQRLSVWTTLVGPMVAILLTLFVRPSFALAYLLWIMSTRLVAAVLLGLAWGRMSPLWPILLYYNQVGGALLKSYVNFRFNEQSWTRQGIKSSEAGDLLQAKRVRRESALMHMASVLSLLAVVSFATGAFSFPENAFWQSILKSPETSSDDYWLAAALDASPEGAPVLLPPETITANWRTLDSAGTVHLRGAGVDQTVLSLVGISGLVALPGSTRHPNSLGRLHCGQGSNACQIDRRVKLSNLTLQASPSRSKTTGERQ